MKSELKGIEKIGTVLTLTGTWNSPLKYYFTLRGLL